MQKYKITNLGCDDQTEGVFDLTDEQFEFTDALFKMLNENSHYGCMPKIYIDKVDEEIEH